jgi:hypothetical protein
MGKRNSAAMKGTSWVKQQHPPMLGRDCLPEGGVHQGVRILLKVREIALYKHARKSHPTRCSVHVRWAERGSGAKRALTRAPRRNVNSRKVTRILPIEAVLTLSRGNRPMPRRIVLLNCRKAIASCESESIPEN